jgi:hypothetical protein
MIQKQAHDGALEQLSELNTSSESNHKESSHIPIVKKKIITFNKS